MVQESKYRVKQFRNSPFLVEIRGFRGCFKKALVYGQIEFSVSGLIAVMAGTVKQIGKIA